MGSSLPKERSSSSSKERDVDDCTARGLGPLPPPAEQLSCPEDWLKNEGRAQGSEEEGMRRSGGRASEGRGAGAGACSRGEGL